MKLTINRAIIGVALIGLIVCTVMITMHFIPDRRQFFTDADTIKQPRAEAPLRDILWQPPVKLPELINAETNVYEPRVSWDGLTLFFVRGKPGQNSDIYYCTRTPDGWTDPQPLEAVNSEEDDLGPEPSADGQSLYFYSNREGTLGGH
ncbi:MAG: PD40 domain-containing protein, partial [Planctomycetes bacterium]|nr:PD40 domain-containing protein [Planctomycetota bacterium]